MVAWLICGWGWEVLGLLTFGEVDVVQNRESQDFRSPEVGISKGMRTLESGIHSLESTIQDCLE